MNFVQRFLSDRRVQDNYVAAGARFGFYASVLYMGECIGFTKQFTAWAKEEKEYSRRGYRTISLDRFIKYGGYRRSIDDVINIRREPGEEPVLHAEIFRTKYKGRDLKQTLSFKLLKVHTDAEGRVVVAAGSFKPPSTEK